MDSAPEHERNGMPVKSRGEEKGESQSQRTQPRQRHRLMCSRKQTTFFNHSTAAATAAAAAFELRASSSFCTAKNICVVGTILTSKKRGKVRLRELDPAAGCGITQSRPRLFLPDLDNLLLLSSSFLFGNGLGGSLARWIEIWTFRD